MTPKVTKASKAPKVPKASKAHKAPKASKGQASSNTPEPPNPRPELLGYSTLIGATYSSVAMKEIPISPNGKAQWHIRFDGGDPVVGHLVDVVLNDAVLKGARKVAKKARQQLNIAVRQNKNKTEQEQIAEIEEIERNFTARFQPDEKLEAYRQSIENGNRPPHNDLAALPGWVQQEILQRKSSSEDGLQDKIDPLPGNENSNEASVEDTSSKGIETAVGQSEHLPGNRIEAEANADGTSPMDIETCAGKPEHLPGIEIQTETNADDTSLAVIEEAAGQSGALSGDKIETEVNVDDTSATEIEPGALRSGLLLGNKIETVTGVHETSSTEIDPEADGQFVALPGNEMETEPSMHDGSPMEVDLDAGQSGFLPGQEIETEASGDSTEAAAERGSAVGQSDVLSGKDIETELSVNDTSFREFELELDADRLGLQPLQVMGDMSTMKEPVTATEQPVTVMDSQPLMSQAVAEPANLTQQTDEQQQHQRHRQSSVQQPPSNQGSSSTQAATSSIPAATTGLSIEEKISLVMYGHTGQPQAPMQEVTWTPPPEQLNAAQENAIQEMLAEFCAQVLWQRYCITPARNVTPEFRALTSITVNARYVSEPTHPVPASFLERALRRAESGRVR
jgi:hypothetical protein